MAAVWKAVDGVSLAVCPGETLGVIGESGSGKSTLARMLVGLARPHSGTVRFMGRDLYADAGGRGIGRGGGRFQMIFQDPHAALNPRMRVLDSVTEPLRIARRGAKHDRNEAALRMLARGWGWRRNWPNVTRTNSPAARNSASTLPGR